MEYQFRDIDRKWQQYWDTHETYKTDESSGKPPYYILDMFPYPSGAGLHVGHPLGYIASDVFARYKRHKGFEVLHPMGYDAFGLPAEQYAIDTGNHPAKFTDESIIRYRNQLKMIGLSYDWSREVKTSDPEYYKWTQWIFIQLFHSWYNKESDKAEAIETLIGQFEASGSRHIHAHASPHPEFTASEWAAMSEEAQQEMLLHYRLAYIADSEVNWCEALGTVLSNDEVKDGVSERGGYPVIKRKMQQWFLRITAYAERLINDLAEKDWPENTAEMQRNWIGKSVGAELNFAIQGFAEPLAVFTTRPDTIFGASFMVLAPEHPMVEMITTADQASAIKEYQEQAARKSDRERMAETKKVSGAFTGAYAIHPFTKTPIPIWIADYVLADYGKGAIMAVPAHDSRDYAFAKHFNLPVIEVVAGGDISEASYDAKAGRLINSGFLDGLEVKEAIKRAIAEIESQGLGFGKINYRLRDANFSRQRYWGEPFPIVYKNNIPYTVPEDQLPVVLPDVQSYKPTGSGESPLAALTDWANLPDGSRRETNTMPGWAGSSWYFLRYMDPQNQEAPVSKEREQYWKSVDFYLGGSEHATGHLLYARFWQRFLYDRGVVSTPIAFKKLFNQGMILGRSSIVYRIKDTNTFVSSGLKSDYEVTEIHVDVNMVENDVLDLERFKRWREEYASAEFILEGGQYICGALVEKMSKRWYNVVTPDDVIARYGCDAFRMYEMFLGPIEQSKPWSTEGIEGVGRFLRKFWNLFHDHKTGWKVRNEAATPEELKILHRTIKKLNEDIERFSINTCVSSLMICVNELSALNCSKQDILKQLLVLISPLAPHIAEELWQQMGHEESIAREAYPQANEAYLVESSFSYPVSINGKHRANIVLPLDMSSAEIQEQVLALEEVIKWTGGATPKKVIIVPGKIVNLVI